MAAAEAGAAIFNYTHTFMLTSTRNSTQTLSRIPEQLADNISRQRRPHNKAAVACQNCARLRVKCSAKTPCDNCVRKQSPCQRRLNPYSGKSRLPQNVSSPAWSRLVAPDKALTTDADANVNIVHMKLFHHFCTTTIQTLLLPQDVWMHAIQLSFSFDFVMNAALCVSARHLAALLPQDSTYSVVASSHMARALASFNIELSKNLIERNLDAFIAAVILIQYELWSSDESGLLRQESTSSFETAFGDRLFSTSSSLKLVFKSTVMKMAKKQSSVFLPHLAYDTEESLATSLYNSSHAVGRYQALLSTWHPLRTMSSNFHPTIDEIIKQTALEPEGHSLKRLQGASDRAKGDDSNIYVVLRSRLCLLLCFLPEEQSINYSTIEQSLLPTLARFIFTFPFLCSKAIVTRLQENDPQALLLAYHFYRAVRKLLPPGDYWWANKRASFLEAKLQDSLSKAIIY